MKLEEFRVLSIDPSLRSTGVYCNWLDKTYTIDCKSTSSIGALHRIGKCLSYRCAVADVMLIEDYSYGSMGNAVLTMGEIRGAISYVAKSENVRMFAVPIQTWKSIMPKLPKKLRTIAGTKAYVDAGREICHREFATCDEVDAYFIYEAVRKLVDVEPEHKLSVLMHEVMEGAE